MGDWEERQKIHERCPLSESEKVKAQPVRSYQKHEFCRSIACVFLVPDKQFAEQTSCQLKERGLTCVLSARKFHNWLDENGFFILKMEEE